MKKNLCLFLTLCFISSIAVARQDSIYEITSFDGGLNSHASKYILKPGVASQAENVRFNSSFGSLAKRPLANAYGSVGSHSVNFFFPFFKKSST